MMNLEFVNVKCYFLAERTTFFDYFIDKLYCVDIPKNLFSILKRQDIFRFGGIYLKINDSIYPSTITYFFDSFKTFIGFVLSRER